MCHRQPVENAGLCHPDPTLTFSTKSCVAKVDVRSGWHGPQSISITHSSFLPLTSDINNNYFVLYFLLSL